MRKCILQAISICVGEGVKNKKEYLSYWTFLSQILSGPRGYFSFSLKKGREGEIFKFYEPFVNNWLAEYELLVRAICYRQNSWFPSCIPDISPGQVPGPGSSSGEPPVGGQSFRPMVRLLDTGAHIYSNRCLSDWKLAANKPKIR